MHGKNRVLDFLRAQEQKEKRFNFKNIEPFVEKEKIMFASFALRLLIAASEDVKAGKPISKDKLYALEKIKEHGVLVHPLSSHVCIKINTRELSVMGVPFHVFFSIHSDKESIGGTFMSNEQKENMWIYISLSCGLNLLASCMDSNYYAEKKLLRDAESQLLQLHAKGKLHKMSDEKLKELLPLIVGMKMFDSVINRSLADGKTESHMKLIDSFMNNIALHESSHLLHRMAGIIGYGGMDQEEERCYLSELAFGNPGLVLPFLPKKGDESANEKGGRLIVDSIFSGRNLPALLRIAEKEISSLAMQILDDDFIKNFGRHYDEIIPLIEIYRVKNHRFFDERHLPMFENLRLTDDEKKEEKKKAA